ncbi:hypothetical protein JB92DRAFT_2010289 [Gautieria morchelliformis]|nr:hypothetical protein JB92DRAFT_2010289 [Gautieria morchelliformis]
MFAPTGAGSNSSHGKDLLDLIRRNPADIGMFLNKVSSVIGSLKSADKLLRMDLPAPITNATTNTTSVSTTANQLFSGDPIAFRYLTTAASEVRAARGAFNIAIAKVQRFFYDEPIKKFAQVEGDVVDICLVNILLPVVQVMNEVLTVWYDEKDYPKMDHRRRIVSIRAQYNPTNLGKSKYPLNARSCIDHVLILVKQDLHDTSDQHVLVIHEAKIVKSLDADEWDEQIAICSKGPVKLIEDPELDDITEMSKMIPQVRKYVFGSCCPYAVLSDSCNHCAMIWGKPSGWHHKSHSSFDIVPEHYPGSQHIPGNPHHCHVISGSNTVHGSLWAARYTLAFLCYLALRDHGLCA